MFDEFSRKCLNMRLTCISENTQLKTPKFQTLKRSDYNKESQHI